MDIESRVGTECGSGGGRGRGEQRGRVGKTVLDQQ